MSIHIASSKTPKNGMHFIARRINLYKFRAPSVQSAPPCLSTSSNLKGRYFSSHTGADTGDSTKDTPTPKRALLYKALPSKATFPRGLLAFTTVHASYWSWYVLDFTPTLQAAAADPTSIDPTIGYFGLGLSIFMSIGSMFYPKSLITEMSRIDQKGVVEVKTFSLPFVLPSKSTEYKLGQVVIDSPNDVTKILTDFNGDMNQFPGHIALHAEGKYTNLLLNINEKSKEEIIENDLLLHTLKPGQFHTLPRSGDGISTEDEVVHGSETLSKKTLKIKAKRKRRKSNQK
jgi:hypothetical protein